MLLASFILSILSICFSGLGAVLSFALGVYSAFIAGVGMILGVLAIIFSYKFKAEKRGGISLLLGGLGAGVGFGAFFVWMMFVALS